MTLKEEYAVLDRWYYAEREKIKEPDFFKKIAFIDELTKEYSARMKEIQKRYKEEVEADFLKRMGQSK